MFTELNKIAIYVFITSKPPYNTGEPRCSQNLNKIDIYVFITRFRGNKNIDIYFIRF